jgi:hypothetical protein
LFVFDLTCVKVDVTIRKLVNASAPGAAATAPGGPEKTTSFFAHLLDAETFEDVDTLIQSKLKATSAGESGLDFAAWSPGFWSGKLCHVASSLN